jgi:hypothetical protein
MVFLPQISMDPTEYAETDPLTDRYSFIAEAVHEVRGEYDVLKDHYNGLPAITLDTAVMSSTALLELSHYLILEEIRPRTSPQRTR